MASARLVEWARAWRDMVAHVSSLTQPISDELLRGHSAASDNKQSAFMDALGYAYLWDHIA